jgi:hypothetical protein
MQPLPKKQSSQICQADAPATGSGKIYHGRNLAPLSSMTPFRSEAPRVRTNAEMSRGKLRTVDCGKDAAADMRCRRRGRQGLDSAEEDGTQVRNQHPRHRVQGEFFRACHSLSSPSQLPSLP